MDLKLPDGVRSRTESVNGLQMHVLEAGEPSGPLALLLHGFPELAYSWRRVLPALAAAGFHAAAPDLRGFGRTTGWEAGYDCDLAPFGPVNVARDVVSLVFALGHREARLLAGHDSGAAAAGVSAMIRPNLFASVALMSAPFAAPAWPPAPPRDPTAALAALDPPRKHYQWWYSTREADADMRFAPQGVHDFYRAYYHVKSGDWAGNDPHPLADGSAEQLARLPSYYVMRADETMAETVAHAMPTPPEVAACAWLPDSELAFYAAEYARTGFQGGLNWYRCRTSGQWARELAIWTGRTIDIPACFIAGARDWGVHQTFGALEAMRATFSRMGEPQLIPGAGHWVQQEAAEEVGRRLLAFVRAP
jgi:pimeloyl-ACP methyl ester carboxylesterase